MKKSCRKLEGASIGVIKMKSKNVYDICIDLPATVDDVTGHLERELGCTVNSIKTIFSIAKEENKLAPFFGTGFNRYEVNLGLPKEVKKDDIRRYFEDNIHCNVVYYLSANNSKPKNKGRRK